MNPVNERTRAIEARSLAVGDTVTHLEGVKLDEPARILHMPHVVATPLGYRLRILAADDQVHYVERDAEATILEEGEAR